MLKPSPPRQAAKVNDLAESLAPFCFAPKFGTSLWHTETQTHTQTENWPPASKTICGKYGNTGALARYLVFLRWRLISEGLPLLRCSNGREREGEELSIATAVHASRDVCTLGVYRR